MQPSNPRGAEGGFTLVETILTSTMLVAVMAIVVSLTRSTGQSSRYSRQMARATEVCQEVLNDIRNELMSSVVVFDGNASGHAYRDLLGLSADSPAIPVSVLAVGRSNAVFEQESTARQWTGNALLLARHAWTSQVDCSSSRSYQVDVYRLVYYYQSPIDGGPRRGSPIGLNLAKFVSEPLIDGATIDDIGDLNDRAEVLLTLGRGSVDVDGESREPVQVVWIRGGDLADEDTLRQTDMDSGVLMTTPDDPRPKQWRILRDGERSLDGLLNYRRFSIESNFARGGRGVARFGLAESGAFPHGFEVQSLLGNANKQVLLHLSIVSTEADVQRARADLVSIYRVDDV